MLTMAPAPGRPAQDRHTRAAVKKGEDTGLRALPRSGVWDVRQTAVRLHRLATVLAIAGWQITLIAVGTAVA